jgi:prefoldin subunit 5
MDNWTRQDQLAHEGRRVMFDRLELIAKQIERIATDVENVQQDVAEMKKEIEEEITPTIEMVEKRKERRTGAQGVWILIGSGVMMAISALTYVVDKAITFFTHKP